jgi:hypothetical protein
VSMGASKSARAVPTSNIVPATLTSADMIRRSDDT